MFQNGSLAFVLLIVLSGCEFSEPVTYDATQSALNTVIQQPSDS